jgi:type IV pilus assembly protein PilB
MSNKGDLSVKEPEDLANIVPEKGASLGGAFGQSKVKKLEAAPEKINRADLSIISEDSARKYQMAVFKKEGRVIQVAMVDPQNIEALNVLRFITERQNLEPEIYLAGPEIIEGILNQYGTAEKMVEEAMHSLQEEEGSTEDFKIKSEKTEDEIKSIMHDAPIAKLVQVVIRHAIEGRASDIHVEPIDKQYRVRFRVDGILHSSLTLPKDVGMAVVSRIKILSNLKIDEKRKPQDGRFQIVDNGDTIDFRVSTLPVVEGEKVVLRVLDKDKQALDLKSLGLWGSNFELLSERIRDPFGIILISGPTGSGKSTTLYGFLKILNQEERNIITLEDPVEYFVEGLNQSQIKPEIGYTFANGLRTILRQDPNVIMVGEIRDSETAELAIHAALTGHLIFSTVHTNDSIGSIPRLVDMGIEPFLLTSALRVVVAQRLARKICEFCREEISISEAVKKQVKDELENVSKEELEKYGVDLSQIKFYQGKGCEKCNKLGFKGRIAIFEALEVDKKIQEIITSKKDSEMELRLEAKRRKMMTMRQDGFLKAIKGITALSEIERLTEGESEVGGDMEDDKG